MHIPDGFLNSGTATSLIGAALGAVAFAVNKVRQVFFVKEKAAVLKTPEGLEIGGGVVTKLTEYGKSKLVKMLMLGLFIFGAQYFDLFVFQGFPVHFLGGALAAIMLGAMEGFLVMAAVLLVQSLALGDGGLMALGANIFNMGVVATIGSYYLYHALRKKTKMSLAAFGAALAGVVLAVVFYARELTVSGAGQMSLGQLLAVGLLAGFIEGLLTVGFLGVFRHQEN